MTFTSPTHCLRWYYTSVILLTNAPSLNVFYEKTFRYSKKRFVSTRLDLMVTIGYYINQLSQACQFIFKGFFLANLSPREIAKMLNDIQRTRSYNSYRVNEMYHENLGKLRKQLTMAGLINGK